MSSSSTEAPVPAPCGWGPGLAWAAAASAALHLGGLLLIGVALEADVPSASAGAGTPAVRSPASAIPGVRRYYTTRELDVKPAIRTRVEPEYPEAAARRFLGGKVVVRLFIDEAGVVERAVAVKAEPAGYFEKAAERAFAAARFAPGKINGLAVPSELTVEVVFESVAPPKMPGE